MTLWAGYGRVSRVGDRADTLISDQQQIQRVTEFAHQRNLNVEMLPIELDVSGSKAQRPILEQALRGIEDGRYAGVIVPQLDRLSRMDMKDALATIARIEDAGGQVIAVAENWDASTPEGEMARNMMLSLGNMQWRRYSAQLAAAKAQAVHRGIWPTNTPPQGYRKNQQRQLEPDRNAPRVVAAFEARATGKSWVQVAQILKCSPSGAKRLIANRAYLGEIHLKGIASNTSAHEPLVDRALWEAAQLPMPRSARKGRQRALLAGLVRCAGCQRLMGTDMDRRGTRLYRCTPYNALGRCPAPAAIVCHLIDPYVTEAALTYSAIARVESGERTNTIEQAEKQLRDAEAGLAAYMESADVRIIGVEAFRAGQERWAKDVRATRANLAAERLAIPPHGPTGDLLDLWPDMTDEERGHYLRGLLGVVWIRRGRLPVADRARIILREGVPDDLPRPGRGAFELVRLDWPDSDLPGEIRPLRLEDVEEGATGSG